MTSAATATSPAPTRARLPLVTYVLAAGTFLMGTSEFMVAGLLPEVAHDFSVDVAGAGLAITAFALGMVVGTPVMVLLTLRLPRRRTLAIALAVFALGHVVVALTDVFAVLLAARFLTAVATGAFWAVSSLVATDTAGPRSSTRALGVVQSGAMLANVVGVPLGSFSGQAVGWRGPFWVLAALAAAAVIAVLRLVPHDAAGRPVPSVRTELAALRSGRLWLALLTCALVTGGVLSVFSYISPLLTDRTGLPNAAVPAVLVLFGAAALVGSLVAGHLGDARPNATMLVSAATTLVAIVALAAFSTAPIATVALFGILGLTGLSANSILIAIVIRSAGSAPTLAGALIPSAFNAGTAVGTGISAATLNGPLGALAPLVVGAAAAALVLGTFGTIAILDRRRVPARGEGPSVAADRGARPPEELPDRRRDEPIQPVPEGAER
jgi:predicted MFS family arabinose efflux permease